MRHVPSPVTIVTVSDGGRRWGLTATSVATVSAEPPQVLVCVDAGSRTSQLIHASGHFAVNYLASEAVDVARRFSRPLSSDERFDHPDWALSPGGRPVLASALVWLDCVLVESKLSATHRIVIGRIDHIHRRLHAAGLLYLDGNYLEL